MKNFLDLCDINGSSLREIIDDALNRKNKRNKKSRAEIDSDCPLSGKILAMLFQKPSTRTRISFDVAMRQLGGQTLLMNSDEMQLQRGETLGDTARVLSKYVDVLVVRAKTHEMLKEIANNSSIPVINGLTNMSHPCQILADLMTYEECRGSLEGKKFAWCGDGNNVASTWAQASARFGFSLIIASPTEFSVDNSIIDWANSNGGNVVKTTDPVEAVAGSDCVLTDVWISMNDEQNNHSLKKNRQALFEPYRVTKELMSKASKDALFMHCLPAHRGEEVDAEVIEGEQSVVWLEVENRLHVQKSILVWCFKD